MRYTYRAFLKKGIDLAPLEIEKGAGGLTYFCTPRGARIIGWAGVDGILTVLSGDLAKWFLRSAP